VRLACEEKGDAQYVHTALIVGNIDAHYGGASPFYLAAQKRISTKYSPLDPPSALKRMTVVDTCVHVSKRPSDASRRKTRWSTSYQRSSNWVYVMGLKVGRHHV
jgi:hypothetical protein